MLKYDFPDLWELVVEPTCLVATNFLVCGREIVWNSALRRNMHDWEIPRVADFLARLQMGCLDPDQGDRQVWKVASGGEFSAKSCYGSIAMTGQREGPWRDVWYDKVPPKIQFFMWTAVLERISTMDAL